MDTPRWSLSLSNLFLYSFDPSIPKAERKASERQGRREAWFHRNGTWEAIKKEVQKQAQNALDATLMSSLRPGVRFIAEGHDAWMGYEYCIYEIVSVDGTQAKIRMLYSGVGDDSLFRKDDPYNELDITVAWLLKKALVFPSQIDSRMKLLENAGVPEWGNSSIVTTPETLPESTDSLWYVSKEMQHPYHMENVRRLHEMFLSEPNTSIVKMDSESQVLTVTWIPYTVRYRYDGSPVAAPEFDSEYWFSNQYKYTVDTILKACQGKQVRIHYSEIIRTSDFENFIEIPGSIVTWIIWELDATRRWLGSIQMIDGLRNGESITHIPEEAFLTWCRIECV